MRTIKFRGKHVHIWKENGKFDGVWVYGYLCSNHNIYDETINADMLVLPSTVGQFTGLYDKNGTEIYEGDIVKGIYSEYENETVHEVKYFVEDYKYPAFDLEPCIDFAEGNSLQYATIVYTLEIIGNIHDNKEIK